MRLSTWLFLLFVLLPLAELALLMVLADWTNWKVSLAVVIVTGAIGGLVWIFSAEKAARDTEPEAIEAAE